MFVSWINTRFVCRLSHSRLQCVSETCKGCVLIESVCSLIYDWNVILGPRFQINSCFLCLFCRCSKYSRQAGCVVKHQNIAKVANWSSDCRHVSHLTNNGIMTLHRTRFRLLSLSVCNSLLPALTSRKCGSCSLLRRFGVEIWARISAILWDIFVFYPVPRDIFPDFRIVWPCIAKFAYEWDQQMHCLTPLHSYNQWPLSTSDVSAWNCTRAVVRLITLLMMGRKTARNM